MRKIKSFIAFMLIMSLVMSLMGCESSSDSSGKKRRRRERDRDRDRVEETTERDSGNVFGTEPAEPVIETIAVNPNELTADGKVVLNIWSFTDEVPSMVDTYITLHPEFAERYEVCVTIYPTADGSYQPRLDAALVGSELEAPDLYCVESAFALKYTQGDMAEYAESYENLGITSGDISAAELAPYSVDVGTRPADGKVVALAYQSTSSAFIYRRSIAMEVFGTDDPATIGSIIGAGTQSWNSFFAAAETLANYDYAIVSGDGDIWHSIENSSSTPWIVNDRLTISPEREAFLDYSMTLTANEYSNCTSDWQEAWFADMAGIGYRPCFGFFGPAWLVNYTICDNCGGTYGDWAICPPPVGFFWGGTWLMCNRYSSDAKKAGVAELLRWITVDTSTEGLQYLWANGLINGYKDAVTSSVVMSMADGTLDFLGGQNMFEVYGPANTYVNGNNLTQYDETINQLWRDQVRQYTAGEKTREQAIEDFRLNVSNILGIAV